MASTPAMVPLIERTKRGEPLTDEEIRWICTAYVSGEIPDYQVAAWLMAVRWRGLSEAETGSLTMALVGTGRTLEWPTDRPVVDKHSTGGVGDKTSIALVPLLAAAGVTFVKMSGRGLGHTGGTLDKLESIPGFEVDLPLDRIRAQVARIGCALVGQSRELVPGDAVLYALRDVTATTDSVPLIASSVMSKKLAAGAPSIVLDVKHGTGALLPSRKEGRDLARAMVAIGRAAGRRVRAVLSGMDAPLGRAVGNALEVREAIELLRGEGPADLRELTVELGAHLMVLSRCTPDLDDARTGLNTLLAAGVGADKLEQLIAAQGGDPRVVQEPARLPTAPRVMEVPSPATGWVATLDARAVAEAALRMGAGRRQKGDSIDPRSGVRLLVGIGDSVETGQPLAELHVGERGEAEARQALLGGVEITSCPLGSPKMEREVIA
jgi:pyrimidine-nucleoside phosphorylase